MLYVDDYEAADALVRALDWKFTVANGSVDLLRMSNVLSEEDYGKYVSASRYLRAVKRKN